MYILGISCYYHDSASALLRDGELIAAAEEERFSRKKHDSHFPAHAIRFCLETGNISAQDLDYVVFYEKPFEKFERILMTTLQMYPKAWKVFRESMSSWLVDKLWIKQAIQSQLGISKDKILFTQHHISHAASTFFASSFDEAAIMTVDGVGEWATATYGIGKENQIKLLKEIRFPHSLGLLYSTFTAFLGFEVNEGEYKVMGMAPYGEPCYVDKVWKLVQSFQDGSFCLNMDYFSYHYSPSRMFNRKFEALFGKPRSPEALFFTESTGFPDYFGEKPGNYRELCEENRHFANIAASVQKVTEDVLVNMARVIKNETGLDKLCIAGGVGLNSVANTRIMKESGFKQLFIQPAAGDSGGALGAALYVAHSLLGQPRQWNMTHAYWGKAYSDDEVKTFLESENICYTRTKDEDELLEKTTDALINGHVVGWFQGRFEWGPRALGNRSILADPRRAEMKDIVNTKIKYREPYRPFAPSVLADEAEKYFDLSDEKIHDPARFMLFVMPVREEKRTEIPAVTHVDGTGRLQTVFKDTNPRYYNLIHRFGSKTAVPVILNTSFNLRGEPIVSSPADAYKTFIRSGMDFLVMGNCIVSK